MKKNPHDMRPSTAALSLIKASESMRLTAYLDTGGVWTVGFGHTGPDVHEGLRITEAKALQLFEEDVNEAADIVRRLVEVSLTQGQFDALTSFVYNIGAGQFADSTMLRLLNKGLYEAASDEFPRWVYDNKVRLRGLVIRRAKEQMLFESDSVPSKSASASPTSFSAPAPIGSSNKPDAPPSKVLETTTGKLQTVAAVAGGGAAAVSATNRFINSIVLTPASIAVSSLVVVTLACIGWTLWHKWKDHNAPGGSA